MEPFCSCLLLQSSQAPISSKIRFKRKLLLCFQVQSANHWKLCIFPPIRLRMWNFVHFPFSVQFFAQPGARRDSELKVKMFSIANSNFKNYSENERLHHLEVKFTWWSLRLKAVVSGYWAFLMDTWMLYEVKVNIDIFQFQEKVKIISQFQIFFFQWLIRIRFTPTE